MCDRGSVIEVFSRSGLHIIGFKVHQMSVAQAKEFYGPVLPSWRKSWAPRADAKTGKDCGIHGGRKPSKCPPEERIFRERRNRLLLFIKASMRFAKIRDVLVRPIRPKRPGVYPKRVWSDDHDQRGARLRLCRERETRNGDRRADENNFKPLIENFYRRQ